MMCPLCGTRAADGTRVCGSCGSRLVSAEPHGNARLLRRFRGSPWLMRGMLVVTLVLGVHAFLDQLLRTYHPVIERQPTVAMATVSGEVSVESVPIEATVEGGSIVVSLTDVVRHRLVSFRDPEGLQTVPLLAYVTPQGKLVTAMSRSEHCGSTEFYLKGDNIHCSRCASYWNMSSLEAYACCQRYYPDPIPSTVTGTSVVMDAEAVRRWQSRL